MIALVRGDAALPADWADVLVLRAEAEAEAEHRGVLVSELDGLGEPAALVRLAAPWDAPVGWWVEHLPRGRRAFVVSRAVWTGAVWLDGPLAHVLADGSVASYLPAGGDGALVVPRCTAAGLRGMALSEALALEDPGPGEMAERCLTAQVRARVLGAARGDGLAAAIERVELTANLAELSPAAAIMLVLARRAFPAARVELCVGAAPREWPAAWRRLCENAGVAGCRPDPVRARARARARSTPDVAGLRDQSAAVGDGRAAARLPLAALAAAVPEHLVDALATRLSRPSEVLPPRIFTP